jgi:hypothetical protein
VQELDSHQASQWIRSHKLAASPYSFRLRRGPSYLQFLVPRGGEPRFSSGLVDTVIGGNPSLLQVIDWSGSGEPIEDDPLASLNRTFPAKDFNWQAASGVAFEANELQQLIASTSYILNHGMSAYLYSPCRPTLYLWEGELIDLWTMDKQAVSDLLPWLSEQGAKITSRAHRSWFSLI